MLVITVRILKLARPFARPPDVKNANGNSCSVQSPTGLNLGQTQYSKNAKEEKVDLGKQEKKKSKNSYGRKINLQKEIKCSLYQKCVSVIAVIIIFLVSV